MESADEPDACRAELADLVARAGAGEDQAATALREFLASHPEIWEQCADLGAQLIRIWIDRIACGDALQRESLQLKVEQLQAEYAGQNPTPLERLLVERVIIGWLRLEQITGLAAQVDSLQQQAGWYILKRQNRAHRQFLNAVETLAMVRRMAPNLRS